MTAKEYLQQYADAIKLVQQLQEEYDEQMEMVDNIRSSLGGDGLPRGGDVRREVEDKALELAEKAQELKEAEIWAVATRQQIYNTIKSMPARYRDVLRERYIELEIWRTVANAVGYSESHVYVLHREALEIMQNMIDGRK